MHPSQIDDMDGVPYPCSIRGRIICAKDLDAFFGADCNNAPIRRCLLDVMGLKWGSSGLSPSELVAAPQLQLHI
jgi:hypothetical protein